MKNRDAKNRTFSSTILKTKRKKVKNIKQEEFNESLVLKNFEKEKELNEYTDLKTTVLQNLPWDDSDIEITKQTSILIIDDDESICKTMSLILEKKGHTIDIAKTGEEAIKKAQERYFNMAILDIKLPDIEGVELIKPLKKINPDIEIIVATGYASLETSMKALNEGATYYITKPINMDEMLLTINRSIEKQRLKIDNRRLLKEVQKELVERNKAEKKKKESEVKFRNIFENANDGMVILSKSGKVLDINNKIVKILGGSKEEFIGKHFTKIGILSLKQIPKLMKFFSKILRGKEVCISTKIKNKKGKEKYLECSANLIKTVNKTQGIMVIARDVTEKKKSEEEIRKSEEKYRSIVENINDALIIHDFNWKILDVNENTEKMLNFKREELIGKKIDKIRIKETLEIYNKRIKKLLKSEKLIFDNYLLNKDRKQIPVTISTKLVTKKGNGIIQTFVRDITERKSSELELKKSEERYRELVEKSDIGIVTDDIYGNFVYFNDKFPEIFGYTKDELKTKSIKNLVHPDDINRIMKIHKSRFLSNKVNKKYEFKGIKKDGTTIYLEIEVAQLKVKDKIIGAHSYIRDITERKNAEKLLQKSEERLDFLVSQNPSVIYTSKVSGDFGATYISPNISVLLGYKPEDFTGDSNFWINNIHPKDKDRIIEGLSHPFKNDHHVHEYRFKEIAQYLT